MREKRPYTILAVDDNRLNLKLIETALTKEGYMVTSVTNGPDARKIALKSPPDLILLDIEMPDENGFDVIAKLKQQSSTNDIPVIFLTGLDNMDAKLKGFDLGAVDYITKPFHPREVLARVRIHLKLSIATNSLILSQAEKLKQVTEAQESMLPTPEDHPSARFSVHYQSLDEAGGDFYDILNVSDKITGYFVADSAGHDIETSYITASVKALLAQNCTPVYAPLESMNLINNILVEILPKDKYLTAGYIHLNRQTKSMTLINAGHPPVVYVPQKGKPFLIQSQGDVLGIFPDAHFGIQHHRVTPGDRIFIFSDGLVESPKTKVNWAKGAQDLLPDFEQLKSPHLSEAPQKLIQTVFGSNPSPEDDIVVMCIEV